MTGQTVSLSDVVRTVTYESLLWPPCSTWATEGPPPLGYGVGLTSMKQSGSWYYFLADGLGSTMAVVNASGVVQDSYTYDVYGDATKTGSLANEFDFAGQQTDATGLQYLRARYYDPATGTFLSREPMASLPEWLGSSVAYGAGSPARYSDRTGLWPGEGAAKKVSKGAGDAFNAATGAAASGYDSATSAAKSIKSAVADPLSPDINNLLTFVQFLDTLPSGAGCIALTIANAAAGGACMVLDKAIGAAAFIAASLQAGINTCSPPRNGAYFGLAAVSVAADLLDPGPGIAKGLAKEAIESVVDSGALLGQTAVTAGCSGARPAYGGEKS